MKIFTIGDFAIKKTIKIKSNTTLNGLNQSVYIASLSPVLAASGENIKIKKITI